MQTLPAAFSALSQYPQFIIWQAVWDAEKQKYKKIPKDACTLQSISPIDPLQWLDAQTAIALRNMLGDDFGIGFVFTENDPFWFLDIDNCLTENGWSELAQNLVASFPGAAVEVSYSQKGLHIFGTGMVPEHGCKNIQYGLEFYHKDRFVALTGTNAAGGITTDHSVNIAHLINNFFPPTEFDLNDPLSWTTSPVEEWDGPEDDEVLLQKMLNSRQSAKAIFEGRASFRDLWEGNVEKLTASYPDSFGHRGFDHSHADAALCLSLAFWTGKNCERMDRLFRQSALYRDKWERESYRYNTICKANQLCEKVYTPTKKETPTYTEEDSVIVDGTETSFENMDSVSLKEGLQFMSTSNQLGHFGNCIYIRDLHKVYIPDGSLLKPEQFKVHYGGHIFALDAVNDKVTKNAWEVFTESQAINFPKAHSTCFRPEFKPGEIIVESDRKLVNTYVPVTTPSEPGDITPFLNHVKILLPVERDREILLNYMAACVQYKGTKFQWSPILQGCEGNGKTLLITCLEAAIGQRYTHLPNASDLGGNATKFNIWISNRLFIGIEDIYISERVEVSEALKPLVTNKRIELQGKGADQVTGDNRANFLMCSNHKDGVRKHKNDRRYCVFFTNQQNVEDLHRDGMMGSYFPDLYDWLDNKKGFAYVTHFLENYQIVDQYNPATLCQRAPHTSSTEAAIEFGLGSIEQEVQEACKQGLLGFRGDWISSLPLQALLSQKNLDRRLPLNKRPGMLESLGYIKHPGLVDGRSNSVISIDGGKPILYVRKNSLSQNLTGPNIITDAYTKAQLSEPVPATSAAVQVFGDK